MVKVPEIVVDLPEDMAKELRVIPKLELSLVVSRLLKERLARLVRLEKILSKSRLSEKRAKEIADEISLSLSKEYNNLYKKLGK